MRQKWIDTVLKNYLSKNTPPEEEVSHILDWLSRSEEKISLRMSYPQAKLKAEVWTKRLNKKNAKEKGVCEIVFTTKGGLNLTHLKDFEALSWEGKVMHHCVASYKNHPGIFSLRRGEESVATIEVNEGKIIQVRGKENRRLSPEEAKEAWEALNFMQLYIPREEALNLGFIELDALEVLLLMENCENPKIEAFNDKDYISVYDKLNINDYSVFSTFKFLKVFALQGNLEGVKEVVNHYDFHMDQATAKYLYSELISWKQFESVFTLLKYETTIYIWNLLLPYFIISGDQEKVSRSFRDFSFPRSQLNFNPLNLAIQRRDVGMVKLIALNDWGHIDKNTYEHLRNANCKEISAFIHCLEKLPMPRDTAIRLALKAK